LKVVLYGATGKAGSVILKELVDRGHVVIAAARTPEKVRKVKNVTAVQDDLSDPAKTASIVKAADAVVSAYGPPPDDTSQIIGVMDRLVKAIEEISGPRFIVVGGAGSLFVAPGLTLRASGHLPKEWIPIVDAHIEVLQNLKKSGIDWTYFSPAAFFEPGERTGKFRLGKDDLITDAQGNSRISFEDYAIALVDELENPQHHRERFTIGYEA
jgi:putative NADH-flavin reductase